MKNRSSRRKLRQLRFESIEKRMLLAGDIAHNFVEAEDVNLDGAVSVLDASAILALIRRGENLGGAASSSSPVLVDVDSNGELTTGDALRVINQLREESRTAADLQVGIDQLAVAILTDDLPFCFEPQTGLAWLDNVQQRLATPSEDLGAFNHLDVNNDGVLTDQEVSADLWQALAGSDVDSDSEVTLDETKQSRPNELLMLGPGEEAPTAFALLDHDQNGSLGESEVSTRTWNRLSPSDADQNNLVTLQEIQNARMQNEQLLRLANPTDAFAQLDINDDDEVAQGELTLATWDEVSRYDTNNSGSITVTELQDLREADEEGIRGPSPQNAFNILDVDDDNLISENEVTPTTWQRIEHADENTDSELSLSELIDARTQNETALRLPSPEAAFGLLDDDGDSIIQSTELTVGGWDAVSRVDSNADDGISLAELDAARQADELGLRGPSPQSAIAVLDVDGNSQVDESEVTPAIWSELAYADSNVDAGLTIAELTTAREANELAVDGESETQSAIAFARLDINDDDLLIESELSAETWTRIQTLDTNSDDAVSLAEIEASRQSTSVGPITLGFDIDGNGPDLASNETTVQVGQSVTVNIYVAGTGTDTRIQDFGLLGFGITGTNNTEFGTVTAASFNFSFSTFSMNDISTPGQIILGGTSIQLGVPVPSGGNNYIMLGSFTFQATSAGTTTFSFTDFDPRAGVSDFSIGDASFSDIDEDIFRDNGTPRSLTFMINSVDP